MTATDRIDAALDRLAERAPPVAWAAYAWGRVIGGYSRLAFDPVRHTVLDLDRVPEGPRIFVTWHGQSLLALRQHSFFRRNESTTGPLAARRGRAFVPLGVRGVAMRGWVEGAGCLSVATPLDKSAAAGAIKEMARYLKAGDDALVAVDGPKGPAGEAKSGVLFMSRLSGCPIVPTGMAARPAVRLPRWDRLLIPMPGARVTTAIGDPLYVNRGQDLTPELVAELGRRIDAATARAWRAMDGNLDPSRRESVGGRGVSRRGVP